MDVKQALMASSVKQAIGDDGSGLTIIVSQLLEGSYSVSAIAGGSVFLSELVPDEQAVERIVADHLRRHSNCFEPVQTHYTASPFRALAQDLLSLFPTASQDLFPLISIPLPLVAGKPAVITYAGFLKDEAERITMHWGYNNWNSITDTPMTREYRGIWQATITVPANASMLDLAFYNQSGTWDNHQHNDYHLSVRLCLIQDGSDQRLPPIPEHQERIQEPEHKGQRSSPLTKRRTNRRKALIGLGTFIIVVAGTTVAGLRWYTQKMADDRTTLIYRGHTDCVDSLAWSPDGTRLVSASSDATVQVWDAVTGHAIRSYREYPVQGEALAWSPDGQFIAFSSDLDSQIQIWDASNGQSALIYRGPSGAASAELWKPWGIAWSPDGKRLASASFDATVQVWDATDGHTILTYLGQVDATATNATTVVAWSPDGKRVASASFYNVQVWDATDGHVIQSFEEEVEVGQARLINPEALAWSPDGKRIASAFIDGQVQVWDATDGEHIFSYREHSSVVSAVAWSPDGKHIASASGDQTVRVWDAANGRTVLIYQGHTDVVNDVAWSPDGKRLASASCDHTVRIWVAP